MVLGSLDPQKSWSTMAWAMIWQGNPWFLDEAGNKRYKVTLHNFFAKAAGVQHVEEPVPSVPKSEEPVAKSGPPVPKSEQPVAKSGPPVPKSEQPVAKSGPPVPKSEQPVAQSGPPVPKSEQPVAKSGQPASAQCPIKRRQRHQPQQFQHLWCLSGTWRTRLAESRWKTIAGLFSPPWVTESGGWEKWLFWQNSQKVDWRQIFLLQGQMSLCTHGRWPARAGLPLRERCRAFPAWSRTRSSSQFTYMRHLQKVSLPRSWSREQVPGQHNWISM